MTNEYEIPHTEQGLKDFIRFGEAEIQRNERKAIKLRPMIQICRNKLILIAQEREQNAKARHNSPVKSEGT